MPFDASSYAGDLNWKGDVAARLQDFLARKASAGGERMGALWRKIEGMVSTRGLRAALSEILHLLRREAAEAPVAAAALSDPALFTDETEELFGRVRNAGRKGTIEDYGAFLFTIDVLK